MKDLKLLQSTANHYRSQMLEEISKPGYWMRFLPHRKPSKLEVFGYKLKNVYTRIHDAYLVLIGRAEIEEDE